MGRSMWPKIRSRAVPLRWQIKCGTRVVIRLVQLKKRNLSMQE